MNIINPSVEIIMPNDGLQILKHIEKIARKCYKSENAINDESYKTFIPKLIDSGHHSTLEHTAFTVNFTNDRGISHEQVRHRICAFTQESTRYANYSKDKFGNEIVLINPFFFDPDEELKEIAVPIFHTAYRVDEDKTPFPFFGSFQNYMMNSFDIWFLTCTWAEWGYMTLINEFKRTPQEARSVLPNSLKTEIAVTANIREWRHIFALRAVGTTGSPHPQMRQIMLPTLKECQKFIPIVFDDLYEEALSRGLYEKDFGECDVTIDSL